MTEPNKIILTTSHEVAQKEILEEVGFITTECVLGMNIFKDVMAGIRDFVGGRSETWEDSMKEAREHVLKDMCFEASRLGGDAVISIDLDYNELTGGGKGGMLLVNATGTAVKTAPKK